VLTRLAVQVFVDIILVEHVDVTEVKQKPVKLHPLAHASVLYSDVDTLRSR